MVWRNSGIRIDRIENVQLDGHFHPMLYDLFSEHLREMRDRFQSQGWTRMPVGAVPSPEEPERGWVRTVDIIGKIVTALAGLGFLAFIVLMWSGQTTVASINVSLLLTIASFTLVGGFISVGGVKLFSVSASLRRARDRVETVVRTAGGCPFAYVVDDAARTHFQIESPHRIRNGDFCRGCHLIDRNGRTICRVCPNYMPA